MRFASVILDIPTQGARRAYTYRRPRGAGRGRRRYDVEVGCAVLVPFGHRQAVGFVVGLQELPDGEVQAGIDAAKVKPVVRAVSPAYFDEEGGLRAVALSGATWRLSSCVRLFTPPGGVPRMVRAQAGYWRLEAGRGPRWTTAGWFRAKPSMGSSRERTPSSRHPSWRRCARASCAWRSWQRSSARCRAR